MGSGGSSFDIGKTLGHWSDSLLDYGSAGLYSTSKGGELYGGARGLINDGTGAIGLGGPKTADVAPVANMNDAAVDFYNESRRDYAGQAANRSEFGQQLADRATGKAPSLAEAQMKAAQDRSLAQQLAVSKSNRGVNPALAFRQNQQMGAAQNQNIAQAAGVARLQEQAGGQQAYQNYLNSIQNSRSAALGNGVNAANGLLAANAAAANGQNAFTGQLMSTAGMMGAAYMMSDERQKKDIKDEFAQGRGADNVPIEVNAQAPSPENFDKLTKKFDSGAEKGLAGLNGGIGQAMGMAKKMPKQPEAAPQLPAATPMAASTNPELASTMGMDQGTLIGVDPRQQYNSFYQAISDRNQKKDAYCMSDQEQKKNVKEEDFSPKGFLDALKPYSYEYKNPGLAGAGEGRHLSVMAQDLEKAGPVGKSMVQETPNGKMVDYGKGFGAILAAQADLNDRLKNIESKYGKKA